MNHSEIVSFFWGVADLIRDSFRRGHYQDVILPLTGLRRLDCVLAPTKEKVLAKQAALREKKLENLAPQLRRVTGFAFYNYKRITDDRAFGETIKNFLFDQYLRAHRNAEELIKRGESKTLEFKSTLRWNLEEDRQDDKVVTHAVLETIAAFLNTEGGDLLIGVAHDGSIVGIERDRLESDDKFMRHLAQAVRNGLGDRAGTWIDPKTQIVQGKTVCVVSCQRSPEPVFLKWKEAETTPDGDFFVRSGPGTVKLPPGSAQEFIRTRFAGPGQEKEPGASA